MGRRLEFQEVLQSLIGIRPDGKKNVYFQPPSSVKMNYPCIVYSLSRISVKKANNKLYGFIKGYMVTVIDPDPDGILSDKVLALPMSSFDRHFTMNNLNHDVYNVYY